MRRFEFSDGKSDKFWEIVVEGESYTVRFGRTGTDGQTSTKVFKSHEEAQKKADAAIASKVKKGYAEAAAQARTADPNEEIVARITSDPGDLEAWSVLADSLQAAGDPRGELMAVQMQLGATVTKPKERVRARPRGEAAPAPEPPGPLKVREQELLEKHATAFFGDVRPGRDEAEAVEIDWENGFWRRVKVAGNWDVEELDLKKLYSAVLRHPSAQFLRELEVGLLEIDGEAMFEDAVKLLVKQGRRPSLRRLHLGAFEYPDDTEISWTYHTSVEPLGPILPNLEDLTITGGDIALGALVAPKLKRLKLETGGLPTQPAEQLAKGSYPALEELEVWFGTDDYGGSCSAEHVAGILANTAGLPAVKRLGLKNASFTNDIVGVLAGGPLIRQLTHLDLSMGILTDEGAQTLLGILPALAHLEELDVSESFLSDETVSALRVAFAGTLVAGDQKRDRDWFYTSVSE
ncbi:MAG: WGR domain-containing protein [Myxococcales bacterium]|nr:WGR domain-containing protein [Myxococcales bacterium]MCB9668439.1 WGR domain-containing protein [Alphaproteobacteria bacterium]MCB9690677.1 WGR domain-containing protein [Alphaproteobacteria bacterium]